MRLLNLLTVRQNDKQLFCLWKKGMIVSVIFSSSLSAARGRCVSDRDRLLMKGRSQKRPCHTFGLPPAIVYMHITGCASVIPLCSYCQNESCGTAIIQTILVFCMLSHRLSKDWTFSFRAKSLECRLACIYLSQGALLFHTNTHTQGTLFMLAHIYRSMPTYTHSFMLTHVWQR